MIRELYKQGKTISEIVGLTNVSRADIEAAVSDLILDRASNGLSTIPEVTWSRGPKPHKLLGLRYNKLLIIEYVSRIRPHEYIIKCHCDCGKDVILKSKDVVLGRAISCGCIENPPQHAIMYDDNMTLHEYSRQSGIGYTTLLRRVLDGQLTPYNSK